ncbi:MAG: AAA family ATPase [Actinomycetota bacterium]
MSGPSLTLTEHASVVYLGHATWTQEILERSLTEVADESWPVRIATFDGIRFGDSPVVRGTWKNGGSEDLFLEIGGAVAMLCLLGGSLRASVASRSRSETDEAMAKLRELFPKQEIDDESHRIPVSFWFMTEDGPRSRRREIDVPVWEEVSPNYPAEPTRRGLEPLFGEFKPGEGGQLILWHGPPGTGKTYCMRALGWAWRKWCEVHYITDPEVLLSKAPNYLVEVALDVISSSRSRALADEDPPWRLLVLEDTGEMLTPDAKERVGQGLSRLLNLVDGMLGQGLPLLVLVTANEEVGALHPALSRPGRCASQVEFRDFSHEEAVVWLRGQGRDDLAGLLPRGASTLAELHALLTGKPAPQMRPVVGFSGVSV